MRGAMLRTADGQVYGKSSYDGYKPGTEKTFEVESNEVIDEIRIREFGGIRKVQIHSNKKTWVAGENFPNDHEFVFKGTQLGTGVLVGLQQVNGSSMDAISFIFSNEIKSEALTSVSYDLSKLKQDTTPCSIDSVILQNGSSVNQSTTISRQKTITNSSTWSHAQSHGADIGIKVSGGVSIPLIADGKVEVSTTYKFNDTVTDGTGFTRSEAVTYTMPISVPSKSQLGATMVGKTAKIDVPFTGMYVRIYSDGSQETIPITGIYNGVDVMDLHVVVSPDTPYSGNDMSPPDQQWHPVDPVPVPRLLMASSAATATVVPHVVHIARVKKFHMKLAVPESKHDKDESKSSESESK